MLEKRKFAQIHSFLFMKWVLMDTDFFATAISDTIYNYWLNYVYNYT